MKLTCQSGFIVVAICSAPFKKHATLHLADDFRQMCWCKVIESGSARINKGDLVYIPRQTEPLAMDYSELFGIVHDSQVRVSVTADDAPAVEMLDNSAEAVDEQINKARAVAKQKAVTDAAASKIITPR